MKDQKILKKDVYRHDEDSHFTIGQHISGGGGLALKQINSKNQGYSSEKLTN